MKSRQKILGSPLSEEFVPPPGIDIEELLKQLAPPLPPAIRPEPRNPRGMVSMAITPVVRGLYLCERVTVHPSSNLTLHECFRTLKVAGLPTAARPFVVVAYLANGQGDALAMIRVRRLNTLAEVYRAETQLHFTDRLAEVRLVGRINRCVFPGPGKYEVSLWVDGELLAQTPFTVQSLGEDLS